MAARYSSNHAGETSLSFFTHILSFIRKSYFKALLVLLGVTVFAWKAYAIDYSQAPMLEKKQAAGEIPAVEARLPENPMLVEPVNRVGKYGGTWRMAMRRGRDHALLIRTLGYENLMRWTPEWTDYIPNIAQSYEVNDEATEFVFHLRKGMRWSDGDLFDADDILFWYEHVALNEVLSAGTDRWRFSGGEEVVVEKLDSHKVLFKFKKPHGLFPQFLAGPEGGEPTSYPSHYLKQYHIAFNPNAEAEAKAAGFESWKEQFYAKFGQPGTIDDSSRWLNNKLPTLNAWILEGTHTVDEPLIAVRNPYFWKVDPAGKQLPYIDYLQYEVVESKKDARQVAREGRIDMQLRAMASFSEQIFEEPSKWPGLNTFGAIDTDMNKAVLALNLNHKDEVLRDLFNSREFRIALSIAIDRGSIIRSMGENIGKPYQAGPRPESTFYDERLAHQYLEYSTVRANQMLDGLGLKMGEDGIRRLSDGRPLSFKIDTVGDDRFYILEHVASYWSKVGVKVEARNMERTAFYDMRAQNDHDASAWGGDGGIAVIQSPIFYFPFTYESFQAVEWARWFVNPSDPEGVKPPGPVQQQMSLYRDLVREGDQAKREAYMREILKIAADEFFVMGISLPPLRHGLYRDGFENVPQFMPAAWTYPTPAPTNPAQYFFAQ